MLIIVSVFIFLTGMVLAGIAENEGTAQNSFMWWLFIFIALLVINPVVGSFLKEDAIRTPLEAEDLDVGATYKPIGCIVTPSGLDYVVLREPDGRFATYDLGCSSPDDLVIGQDYLATDTHELVPIR